MLKMGLFSSLPARLPSIWILFTILVGTTAEQVLQVLYGSVGAENFTYYRLTRNGLLRLTLTSLQGDCDIYISDKVEKPTYIDYELQSVTCGIDQVEIPASFQRPVGIGVYGYFSYPESEYSLSITHLADLDSDYSDYTFNDVDNSGAPKPHNVRPPTPKPGEEEESLLWTIFVNILKIIIDILL